MKPTIEEIHHIGKLAKLKFTQEEAKAFAKDFKEIFEEFKNASGENFQGFTKADIEVKKTLLREDVVKNFQNKEKLFKNAKEVKENYIVILKAIE
ncbi:MAG: aspartyl/glutamyl-tRNA amidotransferase subunit C [Clostridiaceae bacterium]|nr:aspartyl/glutamyl-tRNA amidotransferase subunit C [Clostridiaceae bacterium]